MDKLTDIQQFFTNKSIFITGFSGYLGKAVVEKLLRSCPTIGVINILIRPKFGVDVQSRIKSILESPIFAVLKSMDNTAFDKIRPILGDITLPNLGISDPDRHHLIETVSVVIHAAASVKFNNPIKIALEINYHGTRRILNLCREMKNIASFVYVSTAYSNCDLEHIPEAIISPAVRANDIESVSDEEAIKYTPIWLGGKPNTYTFTKSLAENLINEEGDKLPAIIVRPSIIVGIWKEPMPGFVDNVSGVTGVLAAIGKGFLTCLCGDGDKVSDIIPLDVVVNIIIAAAFDRATNRSSKIPIYNCCSGAVNPITINLIFRFFSKSLTNTKNSIRHPKLCYRTSLLQFRLINFVNTFFVCWVVDMISWMRGHKSNMRKSYHKIINSTADYSFFNSRQWSFEAKSLVGLNQRLNIEDNSIFYTNVTELNWKNYMKMYANGIRRWIYKEDVNEGI